MSVLKELGLTLGSCSGDFIFDMNVLATLLRHIAVLTL